MQIYWLFLIPAILCALFADKIDAAAKAHKARKDDRSDRGGDKETDGDDHIE